MTLTVCYFIIIPVAICYNLNIKIVGSPLLEDSIYFLTIFQMSKHFFLLYCSSQDFLQILLSFVNIFFWKKIQNPFTPFTQAVLLA